MALVPRAVTALDYDPLKDFAPIGIFGQSFSILAINASVSATDLPSFVAYVKANPGKVNYASGGVGTAAHLVGALFAAHAGVDIVHVPYKGGAPALSDLLAGQVQMYFGNSSEVLPYKASNQIRIIGVGTTHRVTQLPNIPAIAQVYPGFSLPGWNGPLAPPERHRQSSTGWQRKHTTQHKTQSLRGGCMSLALSLVQQ